MTVTVTLTRQELYDRVWQTPMVKIAAEYGISGRGLARLCERYEIPVPGRGHWALTRAGYVMERDPLPADPSPETQISINGKPGREKRAEHPDVDAQIAYEAGHPIVVPNELRRPHRLVAASRDVLWPRQPETIGTLWSKGSPLQIHVSPKQLSRALRIFDSLLKACEERGFSVNVGDDRDPSTKIRIHGEGLAVSLKEPSRRTDHVLNAREKEEQRQGRGWSISKYDYPPTGRLIFTIEEWAEGNPHRWSDREKRPIEACLNDIMIGMVRLAVTVLIPRRLEAVRRHQLELENERRRRIYWVMIEALNKNLKQWQENQQLRAFITAVEAAASKRPGIIQEGGPVGDWLRWAYQLADLNEPLDGFIDNLIFCGFPLRF